MTGMRSPTTSTQDHAIETTKPARTAWVISEKARRFLSPDSAEASKMYLVKGDKVEIVDDKQA
jgi:hypothetical protein